jgi:hypothetical protein
VPNDALAHAASLPMSVKVSRRHRGSEDGADCAGNAFNRAETSREGTCAVQTYVFRTGASAFLGAALTLVSSGPGGEAPASRASFVEAAFGSEAALAEAAALTANALARPKGTAQRCEGGGGGEAETLAALLGAAPLPPTRTAAAAAARLARIARCSAKAAPVEASEWELRTSALAARGLVGPRKHLPSVGVGTRQRRRSFCIVSLVAC